MQANKFYKPSSDKINTINDLLNKIKDFESKNPGRGLYFRGQADSEWNLLPTIGRTKSCFFAGKCIKKFTKNQERDLLHRFRRYAYPYLNRTPDEWESLFIARHHGLPVRLLDLTSNPLVALYHASLFEENNNCDGAVWAIRRKEKISYLDVFNKKQTPFKVRGVKIVYPTYVASRMTAQSGFFIIHGDPWTPLEKVDPKNIKKNDFDFVKLIKWIVPKAEKAHFLDDLSRMSINRQNLYPDLDGLAKGLLHTEVLRSGVKVYPTEAT